MTELDFEKACRGPSQPIPYEFHWNTNNKDKLQRVVNTNDELLLLNNLQESELNDNISGTDDDDDNKKDENNFLLLYYSIDYQLKILRTSYSSIKFSFKISSVVFSIFL